MKILVVEDSELLSLLIREYLEPKGYQLTLHSNCSGALNHVLVETPNIIITDYTLPDGNGLEFLKLCQNYRHLINTHYILTSGFDYNQIKQQLNDPNNPYIHFLPKPFFMMELCQIIEKIGQRIAA
jgi:CheY-like chemotaxis protein